MDNSFFRFEFVMLRDRIVGDAVYRKVENDLLREVGEEIGNVVTDFHWPMYERGEMGWFGMASNEKDRDQWDVEYAKLLDGLPEDTWLAVVDCHI